MKSKITLLIIMKNLFQKIVNFFSKKEFVLSNFISFGLFFPWLNCFEIVFFQSQKSGLQFCFLFSFFLLGSFLLFPFFYDKILSFFFSKNGNFFISLIDKGCHLNKKHPYLVGFFYGICFLSFFLRFEMPESSFFNFLNFFLLFIRNLLIIPFMGVLGLLNWVSKTFSNLIQEKVITEGELSTILTQNQQFSAFDKKLFSYLPFLSSQKKIIA